MSLSEYRRTASRLADYLPWAALVGPGVVLNKDGSFQRSAKFRGPDLDSAVAAELVAVAGRINNAFRRLGSGWAIFVEAQRSEAATYPDSTFPDPASGLLDAERKACRLDPRAAGDSLDRHRCDPTGTCTVTTGRHAQASTSRNVDGDGHVAHDERGAGFDDVGRSGREYGRGVGLCFDSVRAVVVGDEDAAVLVDVDERVRA